MLKEFLRDLARWADDPITQGVVMGVGAWVVLELLLAHQAKITAQARHLRMHGDRLAALERDVSRETFAKLPGDYVPRTMNV